MNTSNSNSIAIIGGADGPTSIFITGNTIISIIILIFILFLIVGAIIIWKKKGRDNDEP